MTQVLQREAYDPATSVKPVSSLTTRTRGGIYRLNGIPATPATRGIIIKNGKKVKQ
jgi:hypothetical protein